MQQAISLRWFSYSATYTYNGKGLPSVVTYAFDDGTTMEQHYSYNARGNIIGVENIGNTSVLTGNIAYNYDALGRLLSCTDGQMTEAYEYDTLGNRIAKQVNGNQTATYQYNAWNQLIGKSENNRQYSYDYDKRGNLTEERCGDALVKKYLYDATNHMSVGRNLETGEQTEYGYNALYMRVQNAQTLLNRPSGYQSGSGSDNYVYRALNQKDYERYTNGLGLEAKNPNGSWSLKEHLVDGSGKLSWANDPYISTTSDLSVAKGFNQSGRGYGIVKIDINKVTSPSYKGYEIYPRVNGKEGLPYHYSVWQQETSVYQSIPSEAIVDFFN